MIHRFFLAFAVLCQALASAGAETPASPAAGAPPARPARSGGVAVDFQERKLSESDRTPQGELNAILAATATLKTERPIRYRTALLAPGSYRVSVTADEQGPGGRNLYFVIGPAAGGAAPAGAGLPEEKKGGEKETGSTSGRASPAEPQETGNAGKGPRIEKGSRKAQGPGTVDAPGPLGGGPIKALFHLAPATRGSESVQFSVRPTSRGDRFTLTVAAGSSQGKATLRFADGAK